MPIALFRARARGYNVGKTDSGSAGDLKIMRRTIRTLTAGAAVALIAAVAATPASATCTRLAFSVNDYGKDGPTKDAKGLLDKYVSKWAVEHGIKKFVTGKKDVSCEMFLNFILFDEHTCKASASVCWDGPAVPGMPNVKDPVAADAKVPTSKTTTGSIDKPDVKVEAKKDTSAGPSSAGTGKKTEKKDTSSTSSTGSSPSADAPKPAKTAAKAKAKTLSSGDAAKAAEVKPKAPLPEKPESAPVQ